MKVFLALLFVAVVGARPSADAERWTHRGRLTDQEVFSDLIDIKDKLIKVADALDLNPSDEKSDEAEKVPTDLAYLRALTASAKDVVSGMKSDEESMNKAMDDLASLKDKFVAGVEDMRKKKQIRDALVPFKDQLVKIVSTVNDELSA